jgi:hypothetical protein
MCGGDRLIRWTTTLSVVVLAVIAAIVSYKHMFVLVHRYGESSWTAALLPLSVDGMIVASSMSLLASSRQEVRSGLLPWVLLVIGSAASLSANVAVAEPSVVGRLIAAWPSAALIGSYELLMRQIRGAALPGRAEQAAVSYGAHTAHTAGVGNGGGSYERSDDAQTNLFREAEPQGLASDPLGRLVGSPAERAMNADEESPSTPAGARHRTAVPDLQRQAWEWALANRSHRGDLPSGKIIAERFGRQERWGRLVKQSGQTGRLAPINGE